MHNCDRKLNDLEGNGNCFSEMEIVVELGNIGPRYEFKYTS